MIYFYQTKALKIHSMNDFFDSIDFSIKEPDKGKILLSEPLLPDPFFKRSVVLLVEHDEEGSLGFVLNKTVSVGVNELLEDFPEIDAEVYWGGPVNRNHLFYMHTKGDLLKGSKEILPGLYWGGDFEELKQLIEMNRMSTKDVRFFAGYSGWGKGQLIKELNEKSWIIAKATVPSLMLKQDKTLWKAFMTKLGKKFEIMSNFPEDPALN